VVGNAKLSPVRQRFGTHSAQNDGNSVAMIQALLEAQYQAVERYCNSITALSNASVAKNRSELLHRACRHYQDCLELVQTNLEELSLVKGNAEVDEHVARTKRILKMIQENGGGFIDLPLQTSVSQDAFLVGLSTLKASITQLKDGL